MELRFLRGFREILKTPPLHASTLERPVGYFKYNLELSESGQKKQNEKEQILI